MDDIEESSNPGTPGAFPAESTPTAMPAPNRNAVAEAFERRLRQQREAANANRSPPPKNTARVYESFDEHYELRQQFRRMVDPGILRPNPRGDALEALNILLTLAENIIRNPDEEKYLRFKPTNSKIKKYVVDSKGTLEYAIALGFRPEVENFQPYYVFKKQHMTELKIGAAILRETFDHEMAKEEAVRLAKEQEKAQAAAAVEKVKKAFIDDRKSKAQQDMRERQLREARLAAAARQSGSASPPAPAKSRPMPGTGLTLSGETVPHNPPPRYETLSDDDDDDE